MTTNEEFKEIKNEILSYTHYLHFLNTTIEKLHKISQDMQFIHAVSIQRITELAGKFNDEKDISLAKDRMLHQRISECQSNLDEIVAILRKDYM